MQRGFSRALTFLPQSQWPCLPAPERLETHQSHWLSFVSPHYPQFTLNFLSLWTVPPVPFLAALIMPDCSHSLSDIKTQSPKLLFSDLLCCQRVWHFAAMNQKWQRNGSIDTANANDATTVMYCKWQVWTWSPFYWGQKSPRGAHVEN